MCGAELSSLTRRRRYLNLQLRNEPYPISHHFLIDPPPVEIRTPTDVVLYAAPVGAYAWYSSPTLRQTVYSGIAEAKSLAIRLRNTISFLSRRRPRHALVSPHSPTPLFNESSRGGASGQLVSLNDFIRLSDESKATGIPVNLIPLRRTPFGPHISSLRRFLLRSDVSVNSGLDFCGFGAGALHPSTLDPAPVAPLALQANMSSLSGLAWCGIGTETLAKDPIPSVVAPFLHPNSSTVSRLDSCGLGTTPAPSVLVPALGFDMSTPPALSWRSLGTKVELSIPVYVPTPEFAMLICSLDMDDVEFCPRTPEDSCIELSAPGFIWLGKSDRACRRALNLYTNAYIYVVYICVKVAPIVFVHCAWVFLDIAYRK